MNTDKTVKTASARPENVRTYTARFTGRQLGAIGIFQPFETTVEARNEEEARIALYDRFEHISNLSLCLMGHEKASAPETRKEHIAFVKAQRKAGYNYDSGLRAKRTIPAEKPTQWWGAFDSLDKLRATFDSESEAYFYVRNRGHMHQGTHKPIVNHAEALAEALRELFTNCAMVHKHWGEDSNQAEADIAINAATQALAAWEGAK